MPQFPMSPDKESYEPQSADTTQITANMPEVNISFVIKNKYNIILFDLVYIYI